MVDFRTGSGAANDSVLFATAASPVNAAVAHDSCVVVYLLESQKFPPDVPPLEPVPGQWSDEEHAAFMAAQSGLIIAGRAAVGAVANAASKACTVM